MNTPSRLARLVLLPLCVIVGTAHAGDILVNSYTTGTQSGGYVAIDSSGNFVVIWGSGQTGSSDVFAQRFDSGGNKLGGEFQVNPVTAGDQTAYSVAGSATGDFVVTWGATDGSGQGIFGRRFDSSGTALGTEFQVNTYTTGQQFASTVAADAAGNFFVVWSSLDQDGSDIGVFAQRFQSSGAPAGTEFQINTYTTGDQFLGDVGTNAAGDVVVTWASDGQDGDQLGVFARRYDSSGAAVGTEFQVNTVTTYSQLFPDVDLDQNGAFVVVWDDGNEIRAQRYDSSGAAAGTEFLVNTTNINHQQFADIGMAPDGSFVVAWTSEVQDGSDNGVYAQRYDSAGTAIGTEFRVPSQFTAEESFPFVTSAANGDFIVTWGAREHDGSQFGVFAKLYNADGVPACEPTPDPACVTSFTKALLSVREKSGHEKLLLKMAGGNQVVLQSGFGNPLVAGGSAYRLCIYDDQPRLVADLLVNSAGTASWKSLGAAPPDPNGKGYKYQDNAGASDGVTKIQLQAGPFSSGTPRIQIKGRGGSLPPMTASLTSTTSVTLQVRSDDGPDPGCFASTLSTVKKRTADTFKAK